MITTRKTGHIYYGKAYEAAEGSDNCGTCDGANCDHCKKIYEVEGIEHPFIDYTEAEKEEANIKAVNKSLLPEIPEFYNEINEDNTSYTVVDGLLCVQVWKRASFDGDKDWGYKYLPCNQESPAYAEKLAVAQERMTKYHECTCENKDKNECNSSCKIMGCTDSSCYYEMKNRNRTEKKWYM